MRANTFRILVFFLVFFQAAAIYYRIILPHASNIYQAAALHPSTELPSLAKEFSPNDALAPDHLQDVLYSPEKLLLSDAWLSPVPTFQFGFIIFPACFLFVLFSLFNGNKGKERPFFFTNSYFHTLFLSVILINAP